MEEERRDGRSSFHSLFINSSLFSTFPISFPFILFLFLFLRLKAWQREGTEVTGGTLLSLPSHPVPSLHRFTSDSQRMGWRQGKEWPDSDRRERNEETSPGWRAVGKPFPFTAIDCRAYTWQRERESCGWNNPIFPSPQSFHLAPHVSRFPGNITWRRERDNR